MKHPARWHGDRDPLTHWHGDRDPFTHWRPPWLWRRGSGGPLRRDPADRLAGGVASGIAAWRGLSATTVRIVFVLLALVSLGWAVPAYVLAWLLIPAAGQDTSIGSRARSDSRGIALAAGLVSLLVLALLVAGALNDGWFSNWAWPQLISVAGLVLIWRNATPDEQATLRRLAEPLGAAAAPAKPGRRSAIRLAIGALLIIGGAAWLSTMRASLALLRPLGGVVLVIAGIVLCLGPWWLRIARDLVLVRSARIRSV